MDKSDKLIRYLYKNGAKDKFIVIEKAIEKWSDKEVVDILSNLEFQDKIKITHDGYKVTNLDKSKKISEKISGVHLKEKGVEYYKKEIQDFRIRRFGLYFSVIVSFLSIGFSALSHFSTKKDLQKLDLKIQIIENKKEPKKASHDHINSSSPTLPQSEPNNLAKDTVENNLGNKK